MSGLKARISLMDYSLLKSMKDHESCSLISFFCFLHSFVNSKASELAHCYQVLLL
jgi:hypothetical protein